MPPAALPLDLSRWRDLLVGPAVLGILTILIVPLPPVVLDFFLTLNLALALLVLLVAMVIRRPLELSVFPSLLLVATLYRLSLNVAATRLILLHGSDGPAAAGRVIQGFGQLVVGGNIVVGGVLFLILVVIQFVVITKGAGRIAEVAARFTLDAMPGKQMAIDAELNAGVITEQEARRRRELIAREADFYGAMDGASRFVRGDAVAALVITAINILGGLAIGVLQEGLPIVEALTTYTVLTVGDGLVAQLPALITSTAAGLVVTRAASESDLSHDLLDQLTGRARPLAVVAAVLGTLSLLPGLPLFPFALPAAVLGLFAYRTSRAAAATATERGAAPATPAPETIDSPPPIDPLQLELGYGLLGLVDRAAGPGASAAGAESDLTERIRALRRQFAVDLGFVVPPVRIRDNVSLPATRYALRVRGVEVASGDVHADRLLAMDPGTAEGEIGGLEVREPTFGLPARWIPRPSRDTALAAGYTVVDPGTVVATHLSETIRRHAPALLGRQEVQALLNQLRETHAAILEGLIPAQLSLGIVHRVLQRLLAEGVSIRDLPAILEVLADLAPTVKDPVVLAEHVRAALQDAVCRPCLAPDGTLQVLLLSPATEETLVEARVKVDGEETLSPALGQPLSEAIARALAAGPPLDGRPALLCPSSLRRHVRRVIERTLPHLAVLSYAELPSRLEVRAAATVEIDRAPQAV